MRLSLCLPASHFVCLPVSLICLSSCLCLSACPPVRHSPHHPVSLPSLCLSLLPISRALCLPTPAPPPSASPLPPSVLRLSGAYFHKTAASRPYGARGARVVGKRASRRHAYLVDAHRYTHEHVLDTFHHDTVGPAAATKDITEEEDANGTTSTNSKERERGGKKREPH